MWAEAPEARPGFGEEALDGLLSHEPVLGA